MAAFWLTHRSVPHTCIHVCAVWQSLFGWQQQLWSTHQWARISGGHSLMFVPKTSFAAVTHCIAVEPIHKNAFAVHYHTLWQNLLLLFFANHPISQNHSPYYSYHKKNTLTCWVIKTKSGKIWFSLLFCEKWVFGVLSKITHFATVDPMVQKPGLPCINTDSDGT